MELRQELDRLRERALAETPTPVLSVQREAYEWLARTGTVGPTVRAGDSAPSFRLRGVDDREYSLDELRSRGPVIVSFFRGGWCPFCSMELRAYQEVVSQIEDLGASLVAISPDRLELLRELVEDSELDYPVLSDPGNRTARSYGLVYEVPSALRAVYEGFGLDLAERHESATAELPIPATYLIDHAGNVQQAFVEMDHTLRGEPRDFLEGLRQLRGES